MADLGTIRVGASNTTGLPFQPIGGETLISTPNASETALSDQSDSTYDANSTNATGQYEHGRLFGTTPSDFLSMDSLTITVRYAWGTSPSNTTWASIFARIVKSDGSTPLGPTGSSWYAVYPATDPNITTTTPTDKSLVLSNLDTSATKADWDGAIVQFNVTRSRNKGGDSSEQRIYEISFTGTYTASAPPIYHAKKPLVVNQAVKRSSSW